VTEIIIEPYVVHDGSIAELDGMTTYHVFAVCTNASDEISQVYGDATAPLSLTSTGGFYNNSLGSNEGWTINPAFFAVFPAIEFDSWVTIGTMNQNEVTGQPNTVGMDGAFTTFNTGGNLIVNSENGGSWFTLFGDTQAQAGDDLQVLIAQLTVPSDATIIGFFNIGIYVNGLQSQSEVAEQLPFSSQEGAIFGCQDDSACNYNADASIEDGSCYYVEEGYDCDGVCIEDADDDGVCDEFEILGCTVSYACNYAPEATENDGSCECCADPYAPESNYTLTIEEYAVDIIPGQTTYRFFIDMHSLDDQLSAVYGNDAEPLLINTTTGVFYNDEFGSETATGIIPAIIPFFPTVVADSWVTIGIDSQPEDGEMAILTVEDPDQPWVGSFSFGSEIAGLNIELNSQSGGSWFAMNNSSNGFPDDNMRTLFMQLTTEEEVFGRMNFHVFQNAGDPLYLTFDFSGSGVFSPVGYHGCGCTDAEALNYNAAFTIDDGSCCYSSGCSEPSALNFDVLACPNDSSCIPVIGGCMDPNYANFNPEANANYYVGGPLDEMELGGGGYHFNSLYGLHFDVLETSLLKTVHMLALDSAETSIVISGGAANSSFAEEVDVTLLPGWNEVNMEVSLPPGEGYFIGVSENTQGIFRNNDLPAGSYPINVADRISITGSTAYGDQSQYYYYFYAWEIDADCSGVLPGCNDPNACNYDPGDNNQQACFYAEEAYDCNGFCLTDTDLDGVCDEFEIFGCTNPIADNYDSGATENDGSCEISGCTYPIADNYLEDADSDDGSCTFETALFERFLLGYNSASSIHADSLFAGQFCGEGTVWIGGLQQCIPIPTCFADLDLDGNHGIEDLLLLLATYGTPCGSIVGCMDEEALNYTPYATEADSTICVYETFGCSDQTACNYNAFATSDDGSCVFPVFGYDCTGECLGPDSNNNGICDIAEGPVYGCLDLNACNFNPSATDSDNSCVYAGFGYDCSGNCLSDFDADGVCDELEINGCTDELACNFDEEATEEDGSCMVYDECGVCGGMGILEGFCDCEGNQALDGYDCNNECILDSDGDGVCDEFEVEGCVDPEACNYDASVTESNATCEYAEEGYDCGGNCLNDEDGDNVCDEDEVEGCLNPLACNYVESPTELTVCVFAEEGYDCNGQCVYDSDGDGVCDEFEVQGCVFSVACNFNSNATDDDGSCVFFCPGCTDEAACNYDSGAIQEDGSCEYPIDLYGIEYVDCAGGCLSDEDGDGVCFEDEIFGCTDSYACNYFIDATEEDDSCEYESCAGCLDTDACNYSDEWQLANNEACEYESCTGCMYEYACNFDPTATIAANETCEFATCPGCTDSSACNYNPTLIEDDGSCEYETCAGCTDPLATNFDPTAAIDGDSCDYGPCGNSLSLPFDGYTYDLVAIGDQCWIAENLRTEHYTNGDAIPANLSDSEWGSTTSGAVAVYGEDTGCGDWSPDGDACDPAWSLNEYGRLYNWYAVGDERGLCPTGWHVPTDGEWMTLEMELGMSESDANSDGWRGTDQGTQMKTTYGWYGGGNGTNSSGFSGLPGGYRGSNGYFYMAGSYGYWWSSSTSGSAAPCRGLVYDHPDVSRGNYNLRGGFSVRCLKDAE